MDEYININRKTNIYNSNHSKNIDRKNNLKTKKKKKVKKVNKLKIFLIIIITIFLVNKIFTNTSIEEFFNNMFSGISNIKYNTNLSDSLPKAISQNDSYSGIGQEKVKNKNGYFTTFTTKEPNKKTYKEYKQNGISSWSKNEYWGGTMEENGCGITALATIASGYGSNKTPEDLRKKYYPVLEGENFSQVLKNTFNIDNTDFLYASTYFSNEYILNWLKEDKPILVCVWNKPHDNRWTTASHYLVLLACDDNNLIYVSNPNGGENDEKSSGWYDINEVTPYIAKALFIY